MQELFLILFLFIFNNYLFYSFIIIYFVIPKTITMTTTALTNLTDLITVLMLSNKQFDMPTIEHCVEIEMQETGLRFRDYATILAENDADTLIWMFDNTEDWFYDRINVANVSEDMIKGIVKVAIG